LLEEENRMTRVLMIDRDRDLVHSVAMACLEQGVAIRMAETLCEGVRYMLDGPVSVVVVDSSLMRLSQSDQARLFDAVAPGVPVVVIVGPATDMEEVVRLELQGFQVVPKPFDLRDILAKIEPAGRSLPACPGAARQVATACK
jgi:DNA-binding response OmpR family regulator